jgi:hypothetical protein
MALGPGRRDIGETKLSKLIGKLPNDGSAGALSIREALLQECGDGIEIHRHIVVAGIGWSSRKAYQSLLATLGARMSA